MLQTLFEKPIMTRPLAAAALLMAFVANSTSAVEPPTEEQRKLLAVFRKEFIEITPGKGKFPKSFTMGRKGGEKSDAEPTHKVTFNYSFQIAKYEVPQNLWQAVMGSNPSRWKGERNSVEMLSFEEAEKFCKQATKLMRDASLIAKNQVIRLPSEAEWEYVARAGTKTVYSFGDDVKRLTDYAWYTGNAAGNDPPVGAKKPNPWGLYDIHGYLWEWCRDVGHDNYEGAPLDGSAWTEGGTQETRIMRGGSWKDPAEKLGSAYRLSRAKGTKDDAVGLRCVLATE